MKKFFASIAALLLSAVVSSASAQAIMYDDSFPWRFGIQLGFNMPTFAETQYSATIGWNCGASAIYDLQNFIPNSYGRLGLTYQRKGTAAGKDEVTKNGTRILLQDATSYLHYLEAPVRFGYAHELTDLICLTGETGPYFGLRMSGSLRADSSKNLSTNESMGPVNDDMKDYYGDLHRFDVGWGIHVGILFDKKYHIMAGYDWGLCDAITDVSGGNRNFSINAVVYFD